jgi:hypothetical protein
MRTGPCCCGCAGRDPQHAKFLVRVVRNVRAVAEEPRGDSRFTVIARGTIKVPWGEVEVVRHRVTIFGRITDLDLWVRDV